MTDVLSVVRVRAGRIFRGRIELICLAGLALWTFAPIAALVIRAVVRGGVFTGVTGLDPYDQFQYLAWIRDSGEHVLSANLLGIAGGHVFLQPMYFLSGLLWRLGLGIQVAYLLWAPIAVVVLWAGFSAYARRMGITNARRAAILVLGLFFATPIGWASLPATHWVAEMQLGMTDATPALQPWFALATAIALGLFPLVLLGYERMLAASDAPSPRSQIVIATSLAAALVSWLHSWQGAALLLVMIGAWLTRRPRPRAPALAIPALLCALPLAYQVVLSRTDAAWKLAAKLNDRPDLVVTTPQLAVLGPLVLVALLGVIRRPPRGDGERMLVLWPLAALVIYRFDPEFPPHALQGVTLPLAALAVRGWPRQRTAAALGTIGILLFTVPGLAYYAKSFPDAVRGNRLLFFLPAPEHAALDFLARERRPGSVLAPLPLALTVPAFSGRGVWAGHQIWTPPSRSEQVGAFYAGAMTATQAQALVTRTGVRWVLADCGTAPSIIAELAPLTATLNRFGCVAVIQLR